MYDRERFDRLESASIEAAHQAIKSLLLLNGGASVAIIAFIAQVITQESLQYNYKRIVDGMIYSLIFFSSGAGLAVLTTFISYYSNQQYASSITNPENVSWRRGGVLNIIGGLIAGLSLLFFGLGVYSIWKTVSPV